MKTASTNLKTTLFNPNADGQVEHFAADLFVFVFINPNITMNWTSGDKDIVIGGTTYSCNGPIIKPGTHQEDAGCAVATLEITLDPGNTTINGVTYKVAAARGYFDNIWVNIARSVSRTTYGDTADGVVPIFYGKVTDKRIGSTTITLTLSSFSVEFNQKLPKRIYNQMCPFNVFDTQCGLTKATYTSTGTVLASPTPTTTSFAFTDAHAQDYWFNGAVTFTSGANNGITRGITASNSGLITFSPPLPVAPSAGNTISIVPGCTKYTRNDSSNQPSCWTYSNTARYGGFNSIPAVGSSGVK